METYRLPLVVHSGCFAAQNLLVFLADGTDPVLAGLGGVLTAGLANAHLATPKQKKI